MPSSGVVGVVAPPWNVPANEGYAPEAPLPDGGERGLERRRPARLADAAKRRVRGGAGRRHGIDARRCDRERLLHENGHAKARRLEHHLVVRAARGGHHGHAKAGLGKGRLPFAGAERDAPRESEAATRENGLFVKAGDQPAADH